MASIPDHPNDAGTWTRLEGREGFALWRRERQTLEPVTMYYVVAPPRQSEILHDEARARSRLGALRRLSSPHSEAGLEIVSRFGTMGHGVARH